MRDLELSWIARLARRARWLLRRRTLDARMHDEMRFHIEAEAAERVRQGMNPVDARRTAARDFGGVERYREEGREALGLSFLDEMARDVVYAVRVLRRNPAFTAAVILTFALGIGCTAAIFSLLNGIVLRPLPYVEPEALVSLWEQNAERKGGPNVVSVETFDAWRHRTRSFTGVSALVPAPLTLDGAPAERIKGLQVSPSYFGMLGVHPAMGRDFQPEDEANGGAPVTILSDALWRARYGADSTIVGRTISIDGNPVTVIGIMSASFEPPRFGWIADQPLWLPWAPTKDNHWGRYLHVVARLRPGATLDQGRAELAALSIRLADELPSNNGWSATALTLTDTITGDVREPLVVVFAAVVLLLLMSTVNVASLVTTFARGRRHEVVVRRAIGATPARLLRQQLVQCILLAACGAALGLGFAYLGTQGLVAVAPASVPRLGEVRIDLGVAVFAAAVAASAAVVCGVLASRRALRDAESKTAIIHLASSSRTTARMGGSRIIAAEVAIGLILAVLAALMVRSLAKLNAVDLGFDPSSLASARVFLPDARYPDDARRHLFFEQLIARLRATPGVTGASLVTSRPFACCAPSTAVRDPSQPAAVETAPVTDVRYVDDTYFATARIPILAGRVFGRDESPAGPVRVIVSRALAHTLWGNADPIGKTISMNLYDGLTARVIGVVGDVSLVDPRRAVRPAAYISTERFPNNERDVIVRAGDSRAALAALREAVAAVDASIPLASATSFDDAISETVAQDRFTTVLLGGFATLALLLASIGVYGVLAGDVSRRRKEIGIRIALGSSPESVTALILLRAMRPAVAGAAIGLVAAFWLARLMKALVFGVGTSDPVSFGLVTAALLSVAAIATLIPALRAARVSPVEAIRTD